MIGRRPTVKVGDYVREYDTQQNWTVAAVFTGQTIMVNSRKPLWLSPSEYKILNSCDRKKHERDIRRFAYADPDYITQDDPRALANRRYLENRGITTADARDVLQDEFFDFIEDLSEKIVEEFKEGEIEKFWEITHRIEDEVESSEYLTYGNKMLEGLYVGVDNTAKLPKSDKDEIHRMTKESIIHRITTYLKNREGASIDLDRPDSIESFIQQLRGT